MKRVLVNIIVLISCFCLLIACSNKNEPEKNYEDFNLTVLYLDESSFFQFYGDYIRAQFPGINIVVLPTRGLNSNETEELINQKQPDLMVIDNLVLFNKLIEDGKLAKLDLESDKSFKLSEINPIIVDSLKELGNGSLYGLVPFFNSRALFYNKQLFDDKGIDYPRDGMTWEEVLQLSSGFSESNDIYGLDPWVSESDFILNVVGRASNLSFLQAKQLEVSLHTKEWKDTFEFVTKAFKDGVIYQTNSNESKLAMSQNELVNGDIFLSGKAAMAYRSPNFMAQLKQTDIEWGLVSEPISISNPNQASGIFFNEIFTVNNSTPNKELVMQVFKYLNGSVMSDIRSRQLLGLPARTIETFNGHDISSLYKLKPKVDIVDESNIPVEFWTEFFMKADELLNLVNKNETSVDEMLVQFQSWTEQTIRVYIDKGEIIE